MTAETPAALEPGASTPLYFGPEDRPLFGWVHQPADGQSRGTAVLCQPLLREYISVHFTFRVLAEALAARGITAIRFDYDGTGDSAGDGDDPGRIEAALASIGHAVDLGRTLGDGPLALIGLRMGALLAACAAETSGAVAGLVLWDPCNSGREFLREQSALFRLQYGKSRTENGGTEVSGYVLSAETAEELRSLAAPSSLPDVARALILDRADRPVAGTLGLADGGVERMVAEGQAELMDVEPFLSQVPETTVESVANWLDGVLPAARSPQRLPEGRDVISVHSPGGARVTERIVTLGPHDLFGIAATGDDGPRGAAILFLNSGRDPHTGPNRMWVELSRAWAALGFPCYRFDLSGLGDSPVRSGQARNVVRAPEAFDDVIDVVGEVAAPTDGDVVPVVLTGLCAGAYQALESAIDVHPALVLSVNPLLRFRPPELKVGPLDPRRRLAKPLVANLRTAYHRLPSWRVVRWARGAYLALARMRHRQRSPLEWLEETAAHGTDVLCICGEEEAAVFFEGAPDGRTTLEEEHCRITVIDDLDHGLMLARHRAEVSGLLTRHLTSVCPTRSAGTATSAAAQPKTPVSPAP